MIFRISRESDWTEKKIVCNEARKIEEGYYKGGWEIEINTLEELMKLIDEVEKDLIINKKHISIFDDYL